MKRKGFAGLVFALLLLAAVAPAASAQTAAVAECAYEPAATPTETLAGLLKRHPRFAIRAIPHRGAFQVWWCRRTITPAQRGSYFTVSEDGDDVVLWAPSEAGAMTPRHAGTSVPVSERPTKVPGSAFPIVRPGTVYARVTSYWPAQISVDSPATFAAAQAANFQRYGLILFYVGLLAAICVYHLAQYALVRTADSLFYALYLVALIVDEFAFGSGFGWIFVWPNTSVSLEVAQDWISPLIMVANYAFVRSFLETRTRAPKLDRLLIGVMIAYPLLEALTFIFGIEDFASARSTTSLFVFPFLQAVSIAIAIASALRGNRSAWYVVVAFSMFFIGSTFSSLAVVANVLHIDVANSAFVSFGVSYFWEIGSALEALLLSLALADRVRTAQRERVAAQESLIEGLRTYTVAVDRFVPRGFLDNLGRASVVDVQLGDHVERSMAVLFSDIRGFTTISERLDAGGVFDLINRYLAEAAPAIAANNGFIDKYIGDAIMALFPGGPDDALGAAVALHRAAERMPAVPPFAIGVGVHFGPLMLGTIGERLRLETTVIADAVNLASRVESLTKEMRARVLITDETRAALAAPERWSLRYLGRVPVKGKTAAVSVHEVLAVEDAPTLARRMVTRETFARAVAAFEAGAGAEAVRLFDAVVMADTSDGAAAALRVRAAALVAAAGIA